MRLFDGAASLSIVAIMLGLAVAGTTNSMTGQPFDDDEMTEDDGGDGDDSGDVTLCAGDGEFIDTEQEIAEFEDYDSDTYYVLDDDTDCDDDEDVMVGYGSAYSSSHPEVLTPGVLPLLAAGRHGAIGGAGGGRPLAVFGGDGQAYRISTASLTPPLDPETARPVRRSIGGQRVNDAEVPWQAQLFQPWTQAQLNQWGIERGGKTLWEFQHLCGATLIADDWVLSAAHCLPANAATTGYRVRLGAETIHDDDGYTYRIDRIVPFSTSAGPAANGIWRIHDITLIHFVDDRGIGRPSRRQARPIPIDRGPTMADDDPVYATGWGRISNGRNVPTSSLMKVQLNIVANDRCARGPWGPNFTHNMVICAAAPGRQTCQGDSGGPLVNYNGTPRLVGVVSWNNADCIGDAGKQGIYTRVASYAAWIDRVIGR